MPVPPILTRELLFTYFAGQATALQKQMIEKWVNEKPAHEELFFECLHEWETHHPQYQVDIDAAIEKFNQKIASQTPFHPQPDIRKQPPFKATTPRNWRKWVAAASVFVAAVLGAWLARDSVFYRHYSTSYGETRALTLPDGSQVVLNANSTLQVPRFGFGNGTRKVTLRGEARFSVVHTPDNEKFRVYTDFPFQVEVLGTVFNLYARASGTKLVLQEGKVKVIHHEGSKQPNKSLLVAPGESVTLDKTRKKLSVKKVERPEAHSAWQHGRFVFDNTPMAEIQRLLQDNYGLRVELKGVKLAEKTVSGSIKATDVNDLLYALSTILDLNIIRLDHTVIIEDQHPEIHKASTADRREG